MWTDLSLLIIEVTEETLVRRTTEIASAIESLRERGVRFAVDDVSTYLSGLGQLATLRPTYVKLDQQSGLVTGIDREPARVTLMGALADYARGTGGLLVGAEGVETVEELARARAAGAPLVQGYLLARPAPPWPGIDEQALRAIPPVLLAGSALGCWMADRYPREPKRAASGLSSLGSPPPRGAATGVAARYPEFPLASARAAPVCARR